MWPVYERSCCAFPRLSEFLLVCLSPLTVDYPNEVRVEGLSRTPLVWVDMRVLELDYPLIDRLYVGNVPLSVVRVLDNLLPIVRELAFPNAMPFCLILLPRIAVAAASMCPMPNADFSALCNLTASARSGLATPTGNS